MEVVVTPNALKQFSHLSIPDQKKIKKKLLMIVSDPWSGKKLTGEYSGLFSLRAWPYRIIYTINKKVKKIFVITIAHRQGVYK